MILPAEIKQRVEALENRAAQLEARAYQVHRCLFPAALCACGRWVAVRIGRMLFQEGKLFGEGMEYRWYDKGGGEPQENVTCPDCLTYCKHDGATEQLHREQ